MLYTSSWGKTPYFNAQRAKSLANQHKVRTTIVRGRVIRETEKAMLLQERMGGSHWIPKSKILSSSYEGGDRVLIIPSWILEQR